MAHRTDIESVVSDHPEEERYEIRVGDAVAGFVVYKLRGHLLALIHTEIDGRFEGLGLGSRLAHGVLDDARARGLEVLPFCPFINGFIKRHRDYADLVPAGARAQFDL